MAPKIRLDNRREYTIAQDVYETIVQMVMASLVCEYCGWSYTPERPRVALNTCRNCHVKKYGSYHTLVYVGVLSTNPDGEQTHKWIDAKGMIYLSTTTQDEKAQEYTGETLKHWGFILPKTGMYQGQEVELYENYFMIHGDVQNNSVVCITYHKPYGEYMDIPFLVYRDGPAAQINKRMGIYQKAKAQHEATKDNRGYYHLHGREIAGLYESSVFEVVSDLASEAYDALKRKE